MHFPPIKADRRKLCKSLIISILTKSKIGGKDTQFTDMQEDEFHPCGLPRVCRGVAKTTDAHCRCLGIMGIGMVVEGSGTLVVDVTVPSPRSIVLVLRTAPQKSKIPQTTPTRTAAMP